MVVLLLKKNINKSFIDYLIKGVSKKIQFRKVWIPNEKQKQYTKYQKYKINKSGYLYKNSICTPSSADLTYKEIKYIFNNIEKSYENFINSK
jgi:dTDP-4-amino-4,6-dideoxygalactose transaminase